MSILLYGCTMWTLTKRMEKKAWCQLHKNSTSCIDQILEATSHKTAAERSPLPPRKTIQIRRTRHVGHCWRSKDEPITMYYCGPLLPDEQWLGDQIEPIFNSFVPIQDVAWKTCREQWTIETSGKKKSGKSVLAAWHNNDIQSWML